MSESSPLLEILDRLDAHLGSDDAKASMMVAALRDGVVQVAEQQAESETMIREYEAAYAKLTAPANRLAVFLRRLEDGTALIALGESEFVAEVDPKLPEGELLAGNPVKVNDAYVVVGLAPSTGSGSMAKVAETRDDGRIRIAGAGTDDPGRLIQRSHSLSDQAIKAGDLVRVDPTGKLAIEWLPATESRDYFYEEVPEVHWDEVGGQDEAIQLIRQTIEQPLLHPEVYARFDKKPLKGILLYGPPGCGKTLIGKATAFNLAKAYSDHVGHDVDHYFMHISGPKILNMWLGETERMVREIFRTAREKAKEGRLVFIFMDEAESVLRTRSSGRWLNISNTVVPQFCAELDGLVALDNVVLILTSNRPDYIDPAILRPERIDRKVRVKRPDREASRTILGIHLREGLPMDPSWMAKHKCDVDAARTALIDRTIEKLWATSPQTEVLRVTLRNGSNETLYWRDLVSGALLKSVVDRAKDMAIQRAIADQSGEHGISAEDLAAALEAEYRENEIFPKSDSQEDWLKLLDFDPDRIVAVRPLRGAPKSRDAHRVI